MTPVVVTTAAELRAVLAPVRAAGQRIGFVPTMGALHEGHASLIRAARAECGYVVVSVFVNPTQFGPHEDFDRYPRPFADDVALCGREGTDLVFHPGPSAIYPGGFRTYVEVHELQDVLEGASRPGHFRGVATVVLKLFHLVQPDLAFFGQKDAQQVRILQQMTRDLDVPLELRVCPTARTADGLALSSRNVYLDPEQRRHAPGIYAALCALADRVAAGERDAALLQRDLVTRLAALPGGVLDYAAVLDADTLRPVERLTGSALVAVAVRFGATRLIDNVLLSLSPGPG